MTHPTHGLDPNALEAALTDRERIAAMAAAYPDTIADLTWAEIDEVLAALSQNPGTSNTSGEAGKWHDIEYLMSIIDAAIEDGFDPDEDGPLLDEIRAEVKAGKHRLAALASSERSGREAVVEIAIDLSNFAWSLVSVASPEAGASLQSKLNKLRAAIRNLAGTNTNG